MTTQREPDTSAEGLRKLLTEVRDRGLIYWEPNTARGRETKADMVARIDAALADAAGQAAPVPPPVEGLGDDLHTMRARSQAKRINDLTTERDGLAKEVERLKDAAATAAKTFHDNQWQQLKEAEAKLAVYEAPIGDFTTTAEERAQWLRMASDNIFQDEDLIRLSRDFARLSAAHAECKGENTKLREALQHMSGPPWTMRLARIDQRTDIERQACDLQAAIEKLGGHPLLTDASLCADRAARFLGKWHDEGEPGTALAPASEEKSNG